jgi:hypothetical protein
MSADLILVDLHRHESLRLLSASDAVTLKECTDLFTDDDLKTLKTMRQTHVFVSFTRKLANVSHFD